MGKGVRPNRRITFRKKLNYSLFCSIYGKRGEGLVEMKTSDGGGEGIG